MLNFLTYPNLRSRPWISSPKFPKKTLTAVDVDPAEIESDPQKQEQQKITYTPSASVVALMNTVEISEDFPEWRTLVVVGMTNGLGNHPNYGKQLEVCAQAFENGDPWATIAFFQKNWEGVLPTSEKLSNVRKKVPGLTREVKQHGKELKKY